MSSQSLLIAIMVWLPFSYCDVAHLGFSPEFGGFVQYPNQQHHFQNPFQFGSLQPPQPSLPSLYSAPTPTPASSQGGYPLPVQTPAPVAPLPSTTEFFLPEVIDNRAVKDRHHFIPLNNNYLPPNVGPQG